MRQYQELQQLFNKPQKVVITTHHKPDADALGSSLALAGYLVKKGHSVKVITPSDYPRFLFWMKGNEDVLIFDKNLATNAATYINEADIICCLDFNAYSRINELGDIVKSSKALKVLIDHHLEPEPFADYTYWDGKAAATAELVYDLIEDLNDLSLIDIPMAECIYAGIMTDTGSFRFPSTTKRVHLIIAQLIDIGVNNSKIHRNIYDSNTENRLRFIGFALSKKLVILKEYCLAYFAITNSELQEFNSQTGDTEGLVNYALSLEGVTMAAVIIERPDMVKLSLRSSGNFSVRDFASDHFEGGGHKNASGGKSHLSLLETEKKFLSLLPQYKTYLNQDYNNEINNAKN